MGLNYPNAFDRKNAKADKRAELGGEIYIHGNEVSIGCVAIGDTSIEELFVLTNKIGMNNVKAIIAPNDLRKNAPVTDMKSAPEWLSGLYGEIMKEMKRFK